LFCAIIFLFPEICPAQTFSLENALADASVGAPEILEATRKINGIQARLNAPEDVLASSQADLAALGLELQAARAALKKTKVKISNQVKSAYIDAYGHRLSISHLTERADYLEIYLSQLENSVRFGKTSKRVLTAVAQELSQLRRSLETAESGEKSALDTLSLLTARKYTDQTLLSEPVFQENPQFEKQKQALLQAQKRLSSAEKMLDTARDDLKYGKISGEQYNQFLKKKTDAASEYVRLQNQYLKALAGLNTQTADGPDDKGGA
jgi:uncharacterized protein (DUF3084 family)